LNSTKWYLLKIWLLGVDDKRLVRRVYVPAASTLDFFVHRVLLSTFGWCVGLHGWVVKDGRDGSCFGPDAETSGYIDFTHLQMHFGGYLIHASNITCVIC
jgi:hypothetical protein